MFIEVMIWSLNCICCVSKGDHLMSINDNKVSGMGTKQLSWSVVGLVISRSLVQFPTWALRSVVGQDSLFHVASVHPAEK